MMSKLLKLAFLSSGVKLPSVYDTWIQLSAKDIKQAEYIFSSFWFITRSVFYDNIFNQHSCKCHVINTNLRFLCRKFAKYVHYIIIISTFLANNIQNNVSILKQIVWETQKWY